MSCPRRAAVLRTGRKEKSLETGFFIGKDKSRRYFRSWKAGPSSAGTIVLIHGYAEHGGRYNEMAAELNSAGFDVWAQDHYGHGKSEGKRADVPDFQLFADDTDLFVSRHVEPENKKKPLFVYGHSMGGAIALLYTLRRQSEIQGLILSGPIVRPGAQSSSFERKLSHFLRKIAPGFRYLPFDAALLCHDRKVVDDYRSDPLVYTGKMKIRMADEFLHAEKLLSDERLKDVRLPVLMMHGTDDRTVLPLNSETVEKLISSEDKQRHLFEGMYHEIHNEPEKEGVFSLMKSWLRKHL